MKMKNRSLIDEMRGILGGVEAILIENQKKIVDLESKVLTLEREKNQASRGEERLAELERESAQYKQLMGLITTLQQKTVEDEKAKK